MNKNQKLRMGLLIISITIFLSACSKKDGDDMNLMFEDVVNITEYETLQTQLNKYDLLWFETDVRLTEIVMSTLKEDASSAYSNFYQELNAYILQQNIEIAEAIVMGQGYIQDDFIFQTPNGENINLKEYSMNGLNEGLVQYEQSLIEEFIMQYQVDNPNVNMSSVMFAGKSAIYGTPLMANPVNSKIITELRVLLHENFHKSPADKRSFQFDSYDDRIKFANAIINHLREE